MNELIKINSENTDRPTVMGRELHEALGIKTQYSKWFERMCEYGFTENSDYIAVSQKCLTAQGNQTTYTDHQITIDMAKELCMIQRSDAGKKCRQYFLEVEKLWNSPEAIMSRALQFSHKKNLELAEKVNSLELKVKEDKPKVAYYDAVCDTKSTTGIRDTAKELGMGQKEFTSFLVEKKLCYRNKNKKLRPYVKYVKEGWFELKDYKLPHCDFVDQNTVVTPKGKGRIKLMMG